MGVVNIEALRAIKDSQKMKIQVSNKLAVLATMAKRTASGISSSSNSIISTKGGGGKESPVGDFRNLNSVPLSPASTNESSFSSKERVSPVPEEANHTTSMDESSSPNQQNPMNVDPDCKTEGTTNWTRLFPVVVTWMASANLILRKKATACVRGDFCFGDDVPDEIVLSHTNSVVGESIDDIELQAVEPCKQQRRRQHYSKDELVHSTRRRRQATQQHSPRKVSNSDSHRQTSSPTERCEATSRRCRRLSPTSPAWNTILDDPVQDGLSLKGSSCYCSDEE